LPNKLTSHFAAVHGGSIVAVARFEQELKWDEHLRKAAANTNTKRKTAISLPCVYCLFVLKRDLNGGFLASLGLDAVNNGGAGAGDLQSIMSGADFGETKTSIL
jgi:hypothetical protein